MPSGSGISRLFAGGSLCVLLLMFVWFVLMIGDEEATIGVESSSAAMTGYVLSEDMISPEGKEEWMAKQRNLFMSNGGFNTSIDFAGKHVIHLGAGPRPLSYVLYGARISVVEPLADLYIEQAKKYALDINSTQGYLELDRMEPIFKRAPEAVVPQLRLSADCVLVTATLGVSNLSNILKTASSYMKPTGASFVYLVVSLHQSHANVAMLIDSIWGVGTSLHRGTSASGLLFERGACTLPTQLRPDLTFENCYFILRPSQSPQ